MSRRATLALIAAVDRRGGIGKDGQLLWHESADQKYFRRMTMGCPVIMGRKTWDSLPPRFRPLPGRRNIVITRQSGWHGDGALAAGSLAAALELAGDAPRVFVIGGAEAYRLALPHADELVLTEIDADFHADAHFPAWDRAAFAQTSREDHLTDSGVAYRFAHYQRLKGN
jgi:dihydrofolate reductase